MATWQESSAALERNEPESVLDRPSIGGIFPVLGMTRWGTRKSVSVGFFESSEVDSCRLAARPLQKLNFERRGTGTRVLAPSPLPAITTWQ